MEKIKDQIDKINRETCVQELKEASTLQGNETKTKLLEIFEKCQCIQISNLFNGFNKKGVE